MTSPNQEMICFEHSGESHDPARLAHKQHGAWMPASDHRDENVAFSNNAIIDSFNDVHSTRIIKLCIDNRDREYITPRVNFWGKIISDESQPSIESIEDQDRLSLHGVVYIQSTLESSKNFARWILGHAKNMENYDTDLWDITPPLSRIEDQEEKSEATFEELLLAKNLKELIQNGDRIPESMINRFREVTSLKSGWDGYYGLRTNPDVASLALKTFGKLLDWNTPEASVVPVPDGSLQLEWHWIDYVVEVRFTNDFKISAVKYHIDEDEDIDEISDASQHLSTIADWVNNIEQTHVE